VQGAITAARGRAQEHRQLVADAERAYATFLQDVATPVVQQVAAVLKAENYAFTVFTPGDGVRLASDRGRDDFIELRLDTSLERPQVIGRVSQTRGSRRLDEERPLNPGASVESLTEDDVLEFIVHGLEPWLAH
jgi:hypothetical protein